MAALFGVSGKKKIILIIIGQIIALAILSSLSVFTLDESVGDPDEKWERGETVYDPDLYYGRAKAIMEGDILYRDVRTETPPVVNYLLVIPYLMGGTTAAYCFFFSLIVVISTYLIYHFLSRIDEKKGLIAASAFGLSPVVLLIPAFLKDDEAMNVIFLLIPLLLLTVNSRRVHYVITFILGLGIWVKIFPAFTALARLIDWKIRIGKKMIDVFIYVCLTLIICLPFLILAGSDFVWFLKFFFLGIDTIGESDRPVEKGLEGQSLWRIMDFHGFGIPDILLIALLGAALVGILILAYRKGFNPWKTTLLMLIAFFVLYPKIHTPYFIYLFAVLAPYCLERWKEFIGLNVSVLLLHGYKTAVIDMGWLDMNLFTSVWGFSMAIIITVLLIHLFIYVYRSESWIDRRIDDVRKRLSGEIREDTAELS
jgi:hypothetical protein